VYFSNLDENQSPAMGVGRGGQGGFGSLGFEISARKGKKVVFLVSSEKKQFSPLLAPLEKF